MELVTFSMFNDLL